MLKGQRSRAQSLGARPPLPSREEARGSVGGPSLGWPRVLSDAGWAARSGHQPPQEFPELPLVEMRLRQSLSPQQQTQVFSFLLCMGNSYEEVSGRAKELQP